jgi:glycosyltransferase involved in cell wall biosynthesis
LLYSRGIYYVENAEGKDKDDYETALNSLKNTIAKVDACTAVSTALRDIIINLGAKPGTSVVPCCIKSITTAEQRKQLREKWNIADDETVIAYSGTTAPYQHIEDLTIPFIKKLMDRDAKIKLMILTPELEKFKTILLAAGIVNNVILESFPQKDVAAALTAADIGVLIRKTTLVNTVANPVKVAEYLASGLALIVEYGIGGISQSLYDTSVAKGISISKDGADMEHEADVVSNWLGQHLYENGDDAREVAKNEYSWPQMINVHRKTYIDLLSSNTK